MKKTLIIGLMTVMLLAGCALQPADITTEAACTGANYYWCDDDGNGTFNCQENECTVCDSSHLVLCSDEATCTNASLYWCDDDGDGTFTCQTTDCELGSLLGEALETSAELGTSETDLGDMDTSTEGMGLGEFGDLGSLLNPLEGVETSTI